jgi:hypothetical protein
MQPPKWFVKSLALIDGDYFTEYDELSRGWYILRRMEMKKKGVHIKNPRVGWYKRLNEDTLTDIRKRKWLGRKYDTVNHPEKYLNMIIQNNKEATLRRKREALYRIADGLMFGHRAGSQSKFDMGASYDRSRNQNRSPQPG